MVSLSESLVEQVKHRMRYVREHRAELRPWTVTVLDSLDIKVEGKISPQKPVRFTDVTYEVQIHSGEEDERIKRLARSAAGDCYVTNTLRRSCNVNGIVFHNGNKIDEHR